MDFRKLSSIYDLSKHQIYDASLGRIYQHTKNGFFTLSANRAQVDGIPLTVQQNNDRTHKLFDILRQNGLGYIPIKGHYTEDKDTNPIPVVETSVFVPKPADWSSERFYKLAEDLATMFEQESFIIKEDKDSSIKLFQESGNQYFLDIEWNSLSFSEEKMGECFSSLFSKGKNWVYDGVPRPSNYFNALSLKNKGIIY